MAFIVDRRGMSGTNVPSPPAIVICTQFLFYFFPRKKQGKHGTVRFFFTCKQGRIQDQGAPKPRRSDAFGSHNCHAFFYLHGARARQPGAEAVRHGNDDDKNRNEQTRHRYKKGKG
jgi:hypothetical protein